MYYEKLEPILEDLQNKEIDVAGGSVVGMILSIINSLITYTCNLTKDKKNYEDVREKVLEVLKESNDLRNKSLQAIDMDESILKEILIAYKNRKEAPEKLEEVYKKSAEFCMSVTENALNTLKLAKKISKIGNRMLVSDYKICMMYAFTSVEASIENVKINVDSIKDEKYRNKMIEKYQQIYKQARELYLENN